MSFDQVFNPEPNPIPLEEEGEEAIAIEIVNPESVGVYTEEGGMTIDFGEGSEAGLGSDEFSANLAEFIEDNELQRVSSQLLGSYEADKNSRKDWEETYLKGLDQLGLKIEEKTSPWAGACGVTHPILGEAVVRFQSQTMGEIFPSSGPVKTKIIGKIDSEKTKQAERVGNHMNFLLTEIMTEYRSETEKLLFSLPLAGSAFRKIYYDSNMGRPCSMFVPSEDLVVSYGASDLTSAQRVTHVMRQDSNTIRKFQVSGFYRDIDLKSSSYNDSEIQQKYSELTGEDPILSDPDSRHTLLEMHVELDLVGFEDTGEDGEETGVALPYVVTIDKSSGGILSIKRNWYEDDPKKTKREHFVHYEYVPGLGFYGFGLIHLIGGITKSATSLLRQLVDAGTLANLPGGLKARGLRIKGDDSPIMPGEFRDVDVPGGAIRDNITFLPYKEPSNVLAQLLGNMVDEARRFASLTDLKISEMSQQTPVGTTLAIIERSMKVMSAIQARLHAALKREFSILAGIVKDDMPEFYDYELDDNPQLKKSDFDDKIDVIPVSDPNSSTMAQRIMQYQSVMQLSAQAPQLYDLPKLHRQIVEVMGVSDAEEIIPINDEIKPADPVEENMNMLNVKPVKAFLYQDHQAHIQAHLSVMQDPKIGGLLQQSPTAQAVQAAYVAHVTEHVGMQYRNDIEKELGVALPPPGDELPEEYELNLSRLIAKAAGQLLQKDQAEVQAAKNQQMAQDPVIQMQQKELEIKAQDVQQKGQIAQAKIQLDLQKAVMRNQAEISRLTMELEKQQRALDSEEKIESAKLGVEAAEVLASQEAKKEELKTKELIEATKIGLEGTRIFMKQETEDAERAEKKRKEMEGI